jgi:regulator of sigma E protease
VGDVTIMEVAPDSPAAAAGVQPGDVIREVSGRRIEGSGDLRRQYQLHLGGEMTTIVERGGERLTLKVTPRWNPPPGEGSVGIAYTLQNARRVSRSYPFWEAVPKAGRETVDVLILMKNGIASWFEGGRSPQDDALGPVGIARVTGEVAGIGIRAVVLFAALLSLNLAIFNILPIPALDGGRLFFLAIEVARRGKRIPPQKEALVHLAGFAILIGIFVLVTFNDLARWVRGEGPVG